MCVRVCMCGCQGAYGCERGCEWVCVRRMWMCMRAYMGVCEGVYGCV